MEYLGLLNCAHNACDREDIPAKQVRILEGNFLGRKFAAKTFAPCSIGPWVIICR